MEGPAEPDEEAYLIHKGNIHERRLAAVLARAFPLVFFVSTVLSAVTAAICTPLLFLGLCAVFNLWTCLGMSLSGIYCLLGIWKMSEQLHSYSGKSSVRQLQGETEAAWDGPVHLIVIPNYMEDEEMMAETLQSLVEAEGSKAFHVAIAIEDREGSEGKMKAESLKSMFAEHFARIEVTCHPGDLVEQHLDGSVDREVPGKASNLKWALRHLKDMYQQEGSLDVEDVVLTVADADIIFHPGYFHQLGREFFDLREAEGDAHLWTMWEAPQLPFRNLGTAPACSRVWAYVATTFEFGGISGLDHGGHHIVFSTYSMPLLLAVNAQAHDGDVIAEDHHAHIKCLLYSIRAVALEGMQPGDSSGSSAAGEGECQSVRLRPIYLPSKATSVASSKGCVTSWVDRWSQAKRHARGVAELSYVLLTMHDVVRLLPLHTYIGEVLTLMRLSSRLFWIHMVPHIQCVLMAVLYCYWIYNDASMPVCSDDGSAWRTVLCVVAGVWCPAWPVGIPTMFIIPSNVLLISRAFLEPAAAAKGGAGVDLKRSKWYKEDGGLLTNWSRSYVTALVIVDLLIFGGPVMVLYGAGTAILAFWGVCFCGNRFHYITASKATQSVGKKGHRSLVE